MSNTLIQILRSYTTSTPPTLNDGEQAYSFSSGKLFIGNTSNGVITIGGKYYTDIIDAATNLATGSTLVLRDPQGNASFNTTFSNNISAINTTLTGDLVVSGTSSLTGNITSTLNVTGNVNSQYTNTSLDSRIGRDLFVTRNITAGETFTANNGTFNSDLTVSRDLNVHRDVTINNNLNVLGDFAVQGNVTTLNTQTLVVEDKNIQLANTVSPSDVTADGGGITVMGLTNKTFNWKALTNSWTSSENIDIDTGKVYKIGSDVILANNALTTPETTFNLVNSTATNINAFGAATNINLGASSGVLNINNPVLDGSSPTQNVFNSSAITVNAFGEASSLIMGSDQGTITLRNPILVGVSSSQNVYNTVATTVNAFGAATLVNIGATSGTTRIRNDLDVDGNINIDGSQLTAAQTTFNLVNSNSTTINFGGAATLLNIGSASGNTAIHNNLIVDGNTTLSSLRVTGTVNFDNPLQVISGGTGISYANTNGIIYGNGTNGFQVTSQGVEGNVLQVNSSNVPYFGMLDGGTF